jgi:hypothetical protein
MIALNTKSHLASADAYALAAIGTGRERTPLIAQLNDTEGAVMRIAEVVGDAYLQHLRRFLA